MFNVNIIYLFLSDIKNIYLLKKLMHRILKSAFPKLNALKKLKTKCCTLRKPHKWPGLVASSLRGSNDLMEALRPSKATAVSWRAHSWHDRLIVDGWSPIGTQKRIVRVWREEEKLVPPNFKWARTKEKKKIDRFKIHPFFNLTSSKQGKISHSSTIHHILHPSLKVNKA